MWKSHHECRSFGRGNHMKPRDNHGFFYHSISHQGNHWSPRSISHFFWLVVLVSTPLKTMKVSWDEDIPNIWKVIKFMFQTIHQYITLFSQSGYDPDLWLTCSWAPGPLGPGPLGLWARATADGATRSSR